ncbi:hypothetical protein FHETE_10503 [Fusarium heterosporum]|uniref:Uncharacterized protein n=1 Tax=Fusarium heterosporum TaxID=42747 RepID=A0A8H5STC6_FUSHE|nr:hypothetical protein FHETE_10503 [Fusarium heterosporum]
MAAVRQDRVWNKDCLAVAVGACAEWSTSDDRSQNRGREKDSQTTGEENRCDEGGEKSGDGRERNDKKGLRQFDGSDIGVMINRQLEKPQARAELSWYWRQNVKREAGGAGACTGWCFERNHDDMPAAAIVWMTANAGCGLSKYAAGGVVAVATGRWAIQATARRRSAGNGDDERVCERGKWTR